MMFEDLSLQADYYGVSRTGRVKHSNQDRYCAFKVQDAYVQAVCDGLGGQAGGEVAANMALEAVLRLELPSNQVAGYLQNVAVDVTESEAQEHPLRNQLDQARGVPAMESDVEVFEVEPGDALLLCSDGISDELDEARIAEILGTDTDVEDKARAMVQAALEAGGHDNATAVVVQVKS